MNSLSTVSFVIIIFIFKAFFVCSAQAQAKTVDSASTARADDSARPVVNLASTFISLINPEEKLAVLERLERTAPESGDDMRALLNLYSRFPEARTAAERSLLLLPPPARQFGPYFTALIENDDPFLRMFGLSGAFHLRFEPALPAIRKIAGAPFAHPRPTLDLLPVQVNAWQGQYAALRVLALWEGKSALPLLLKKAGEAPPVAALVAEHFWEESFDRLVSWSKSAGKKEAEMASIAWAADVPAEALRKTWPKLRLLVLDRSMPMELRHRAALKLGPASGDMEVVDLLKEREARRKDEQTRLLLDAALFASRNPRAVPLLEEYVKTAPSPVGRAGALVQLKDLAEPQRYAEVLRWAAQNDPDTENRASAQRELSQAPKKR